MRRLGNQFVVSRTRDFGGGGPQNNVFAFCFGRLPKNNVLGRVLLNNVFREGLVPKNNTLGGGGEGPKNNVFRGAATVLFGAHASVCEGGLASETQREPPSLEGVRT